MTTETATKPSKTLPERLRPWLWSAVRAFSVVGLVIGLDAAGTSDFVGLVAALLIVFLPMFAYGYGCRAVTKRLPRYDEFEPAADEFTKRYRTESERAKWSFVAGARWHEKQAHRAAREATDAVL